jgi:hypothetical protein
MIVFVAVCAGIFGFSLGWIGGSVMTGSYWADHARRGTQVCHHGVFYDVRIHNWWEMSR